MCKSAGFHAWRNPSHPLTLLCAGPSSARNLTPYHLNTLWLEPDRCNQPFSHRAKAWSQQVWSFFCPPISILTSLRHPGRDNNVLSLSGDYVSISLATPSITVTAFGPTGGRRGHKLSLTCCPYPARLAPSRGGSGLVRSGRAEGRPGPSHRIEEHAGTAVMLHHTQTHMLPWQTSVNANDERMERHQLTLLNYAIDLHQQHVKDNMLQASYNYSARAEVMD